MMWNNNNEILSLDKQVVIIITKSQLPKSVRTYCSLYLSLGSVVAGGFCSYNEPVLFVGKGLLLNLPALNRGTFFLMFNFLSKKL